MEVGEVLVMVFKVVTILWEATAVDAMTMLSLFTGIVEVLIASGGDFCSYIDHALGDAMI